MKIYPRKQENKKKIYPSGTSARKTPVAERVRIKTEFKRFEKMAIITPVTEPTPWVSSMVVVVKPNKLRISIYLKDRNQTLKPNTTYY